MNEEWRGQRDRQTRGKRESKKVKKEIHNIYERMRDGDSERENKEKKRKVEKKKK